MKKYVLDMNEYKRLARLVAAESCTLLKNDKETLPIKADTTISIFGRSAFNYYKSGTGSGGLVNTKYVIGILDAFKDRDDINLNEDLLDIYEAWIKDHPYKKGQGWGEEPWSQEEMPLTRDIVEDAAKSSDLGLVIIGRTAGEDQDSKAEAGSYYLSNVEEDMIEKVCKAFDKVAVILNVGNIIDMKWVDSYNPSAVIYVWQGGQEGGNGVVDVLCGNVNPCGKLPDTIAYNIEDYPSTSNFDGEDEAIYEEDIYVGYRYFETFAKDRVKYPFGYGLSYTRFECKAKVFEEQEDRLIFDIEVKNIGSYSGKEVVQIYSSAPQGSLGKPSLELKDYKKTKELKAGESQILSFTLLKADLASYDDSGASGYKSCYVLEEGRYKIYLGSSVRDITLLGSFEIEDIIVTQELEEACAPRKNFKRIKPKVSNGKVTVDYEPAPTRTVQLLDKIEREKPKDLPYTGDKGYKLVDVYDNKVDLDTFVAQLNDYDLTCLVRGEGMSSPKVTPGTAGAFGGVTEELKEYGIPIGCCADGPSGQRLDNGAEAFSLPNGTAIGATFNQELVEELYKMEGLEMRKNNIDTLLGPGINIHRNPLNGRNFEYISEDPILTGTMARAQVKGMHHVGVTGTLKHFAANNQEFNRRKINSVLSERALREIYLKGFEIAVKEGEAYSIMTTYGGINGIWTASNYDLNTGILRNEWGFKGIVMTDWWAEMNEEGQDPSVKNTGPMIRSQNDLYMVTLDPAANSMDDNSMEYIESGKVTRGQFQRSAKNICYMIMKSPVMDRFLARISDDIEVIGFDEDIANEVEVSKYFKISGDTKIDMNWLNTSAGSGETFAIQAQSTGMYEVEARIKTNASDLAQMSVSVFMDNHLRGIISLTGKDKDWTKRTINLGHLMGNHYIRLYFSMGGVEIDNLRIYKK